MDSASNKESTEKNNSPLFWDSIKKAFDQFSELEMTEGIKSLGKSGGRFISAAFSFAKASSILDLIENDKLSWYQKILPVVGYTLAAVSMGAVAVVAIAGASALLPPFIFAAHCVGVVHQVGNYLEAKAERDILRKELITSNQFQKFMIKKIPPENQPAVLKYSYLPQEIYKEFYELRNQINALNIPVDKKEEYILSLYKNMEDFAQGNPSKVSIDTSILPKAIQQKAEHISLLLNEHESAKKTFNDLPLSKNTRKQIDVFRITQEKIWSQDLPISIKEQLIQLTDRKKNQKRLIADLYLRIGHDYLNKNAGTQLAQQNVQLEKKLTENGFSQQDKSIVMDYINQPRKIYDLAMHFKTILEDTPQGNMIEIYLNFPTSETANEIVSHLKKLNDPTIEASHAFELIKKQAELYQKTSEQYEQLKVQRLPSQSALIKSIDNHHFQGVNQHVQVSQRFLGTPHIVIPVDGSHSPVKPTKRLKNFAEKQFSVFRKQINKNNPELLPIVTEANTKTPTLKEQFKKDCAYTFELIAAGEKLAYLEKATPRILGNVFLSAGVAVLSLASTFVLPAIFTPAAPAGVAAEAVLTASVGILTTISIANSVDLMRTKFKQHNKVRTTKKDISSAISPDIDLERDEKLIKKLNQTLDAKNKKTEPVASGNQNNDSPDLPVRLSHNNLRHSADNHSVEKEREKDKEKEGDKSGDKRRESRKF